MQPQQLTIRYGGRPVTTVDLAAAEHGISPDAMGKFLRRAGIEPIPERIGRIPLYYVTDVRQAIKDRPGRGAPGVPRPHKPPTN